MSKFMFLFSCGKITVLLDSDQSQELHTASIPRGKCLFTETNSAKFGPGLRAEKEVGGV